MSTIVARGIPSAVVTRGLSPGVVVVVPPVIPPVVVVGGVVVVPPQPEYEFYVRDPRSLAFIGEIRAQDLITAKWTRRDVAAGSFEFKLPREQVALATIAPHNLIEVRRDGVSEFVGVLENRSIDPLGRVWTLSGPDLLGFWLSSRVVGPTAADTRTGGAEDVLLAYVDAYLGTGAPPAQRLVTYLSGKLFTVTASSGRGTVTNQSPLRKTLMQVATDVCLDGDVLPAMTIADDLSGYIFAVNAPTDATVSTGAVPFSVDWANVESLEFGEAYAEYRNHLYVYGDGSGATRPMQEVEDSDSVTTHFRREVALDARFATSAAQLTAYGNLELFRRNQAIISVKAKPFIRGQSARYRQDFDMGWDVTFAEAVLRDGSVDTRVVAVTVQFTRERGEDITFELGVFRADSQLRRLEETVRALRVASLQ